MQNEPSRITQNKSRSPLAKALGLVILLAVIIGLAIWLAPKIKKSGPEAAKELTGEQLVDKVKKDALDYCNKKTDLAKGAKEACLQSFYLSEAMANRDESLCLFLQGENEAQKTECLDSAYAAKALVESDLSICDKISKDDLKKNCADRYQQDMAQKDPAKGEEYCGKISNGADKEHCLNVAYYDLAFKASFKDMAQAESYCKKIKNDSRLQGFCEGNIKIKR